MTVIQAFLAQFILQLPHVVKESENLQCHKIFSFHSYRLIVNMRGHNHNRILCFIDEVDVQCTAVGSSIGRHITYLAAQ